MSIDVRFKNQGLELIEVQDSGSGIAPANYESVALKHHTSKLSSYSDIATLQTFGFRGEALASLCALSFLSVTTCQASEVPKGARLRFEPSGKLSETTVVAAQKGTTISVEKLFHNLPVRRRELERNIKREWNKVIALVNQYACIQTNLKFTVSQQPTKGKRVNLFSTRGNPTTRENIINIFGAKTMTALVPLDLKLEMEPTATGPGLQIGAGDVKGSKDVHVLGHVSRPAHGDGRQAPDRQMFFVNGRPCGLPQFAKVFNEVYRSYNSSQTPFILADIQLDTDMYDVNVSPDKRSIMLHDQNNLLDALRASLMKLFDTQDYSVPTSQLLRFKQSSNKRPLQDDVSASSKSPSRAPGGVHRAVKAVPGSQSEPDSDDEDDEDDDGKVSRNGKVLQGRARTIRGSRSLSKDTHGQNLISGWIERKTTSRVDKESNDNIQLGKSSTPKEIERTLAASPETFSTECSVIPCELDKDDFEKPLPVRDFNKRLREHMAPKGLNDPEPAIVSPRKPRESQIPAVQPLRRSQGGLDDKVPVRSPRKRPTTPEPTTIIIGDEAINVSSSSSSDSSQPVQRQNSAKARDKMEIDEATPSFGSRLTQMFGADPKVKARAGAVSTLSTNELDVEDSDTEGSDAPDPTQEITDTVELVLEPQKKKQKIQSQPEDIENSAFPSSPPSPPLLPPPSALTPEGNDTSTGAESRGQPFKTGVRKKDATAQILQHLRTSESSIRLWKNNWMACVTEPEHWYSRERTVTDLSAADAEAKLSLTISRDDFLSMRIAGQFNLGFIIAVRPAKPRGDNELEMSGQDELFIIDQHATDEKYNFERLQAITVVQSQRLVRPKRLELTALEEEIVMQNIPAIEANGFKVDVDISGDEPVGSRCQVLALPLSRETTFTLADFEELVSLLGEESSESKHIPRPSKVRRMFAMRACRSSIMIGKPLSRGQMETLVRHMAELDKPWNCPHGRPTMRHLCKLQSWDGQAWSGDRQLNSPSWSSYLQSG